MKFSKYDIKNIKKWIAENTTMMSLIMIAIGFGLIFMAKNLKIGVRRDLLESFGVLFISIFFISLLYEKLLAEKHYIQFSEMIRTQLEEMDNIQGICARLGIKKIFKTRSEFEHEYPLLNVFLKTKPNGRILVICRSMLYFFKRADAIKKALQKGCNLQVACISPNKIDEVLKAIASLKVMDILDALDDTRDLIKWMEQNKPSGEFELRIHEAPLPDSILYVELEDKKLIAWDMTFGRDLDQKRVFIIEPNEDNIGNDLLRRYEKIWELGQVYVKILSNGNIDINKLEELLKKYKSINTTSLKSDF